MDRIRAPYNFVPLNRDVCLAQDFDPALSEANLKQVHDAPFRDGIDAVIGYTVTAETPIFVRGSESGNVAQFFRAPDGAAGLPGSSLRGALRNVVEIASFGRLSRVNDHVYGVRDLHNRPLYGDHLAELRQNPHTRKEEPMPLVSAGWLRRVFPSQPDGDADDPVVAEIVPCNFFKIHYRDLATIALARGILRFDPGQKQSARRKYEAWTGSRDVEVEADVRRPRGGVSKAAKVPFLGDYGKVFPKATPIEGTLVFTGQPSEWRSNMPPKARGAGNPKQHDFVFHPRADKLPEGDVKRFRVRRSQFEVFEFIHADSGQQGRAAVTPNEEWGFWRKTFLAGEAVPVFVLPHANGSLRSFGLAMMFRLAYDQSVRDAVRNGQPETPGFDVADAIFGTVPLDAKRDGGDRAGSLKGRVSFGFARLSSPEKVLREVRAVLGAPKATYYPNYIEQAAYPVADPAAKPGREYRTLMTAGAVVRGWKRYRPLPAANLTPPIPAKSKESVQTRFAPLDKGATFAGVMRVHNLRPTELGAIVWATRYGGDREARHLLGMARPLGFGRVTIALKSGTLLKTNGGEELSLDDCEARFVEAMERWATRNGVVGGWKDSNTVQQLLACARPLANAEEGRSMQLDHPEFRNEFTAAKKEMLSLAAAAPPVRSTATGRASRTTQPEQRRRYAALVGNVAVPSATTRNGPNAADAVPATVMASQVLEGKIKRTRLSEGVVVLELSDGRVLDTKLSVDVFQGFANLRGGELSLGRKVMVTLDGSRVVGVRPQPR